MEFFIVFVHFVCLASPLLILAAIAAIGAMQPEELISSGFTDLAHPAQTIWDALADETRLRFWAGESSSSAPFTVERAPQTLALVKGNARGSYRETWTVTVEGRGAGARLNVAQTVYARSTLYRGAMRLFFPPAAEYKRLLVAVENHLRA